jgi:hypothetical protein
MYSLFVGNLNEVEKLVMLKDRHEDNSKLDLGKIECEVVGWVKLVQNRSNIRLLLIRKFGLHKGGNFLFRLIVGYCRMSLEDGLSKY